MLDGLLLQTCARRTIVVERTPFLEFLFRQANTNFMDAIHIEVVQEFVKSGAILEGRDFSGRTALLTALNHPTLKSMGVVYEILRLGGDVKATDDEGISGE
jgi:ankyrin repeat protein